MARILLTGASHGLGAAIRTALMADGHDVIPFDHETGDDVRAPRLLNSRIRELDVLINCAGVNKINWLEDVTEAEWDEVMDTNAKGIFMMTKAALPYLIRSRGTVLNIVSNAAHVPMTCSLAYNASKGAAHIMTLQLARELTRKYGITVFGVAPNKLAGTAMSQSIDTQVMRTRGWSLEETQRYQLAGLLAGVETPPARVAELIAFLLSSKERHQHLTGCILPYGI